MVIRKSDEKFQAAGEIERQQLERLCWQIGAETWFAMGSKSPFDMLVKHKGQIVLVEAKVRAFAHDKFDSVMIEKKKYDGLFHLMDRNLADKVWYANFYRDEVALVFNLSTIAEPSWSVQSLIKNTMNHDEYINKTVGYLDNDQAVRIDFRKL